MPQELRVLWIGKSGALDATLFQKYPCEIIFARSQDHVYALPKEDTYRAAVLAEGLTKEARNGVAQYVRNHWPKALIFLIWPDPSPGPDEIYDVPVAFREDRFGLTAEVLRLATMQNSAE